MKKETNIIMGIISIVALVVGLSSLIFSISTFMEMRKENKNLKARIETIEETLKPAEEADEYDVSKFKEIEATDIESESKKETIVVYIGRSSCGYCRMYIPVLKTVQKEYKIKIRYIDIAKIYDYTTGGLINQEAENILMNMETVEEYNDFMKEFGATPMTLVIKNNKIIGAALGYIEQENLEGLLDNTGFSK